MLLYTEMTCLQPRHLARMRGHKNSGKPAILVTHDISEAISMADRVLILSARPATVRKIIDIDLDISDRTPLSSRNAPDFKKYFNIIWKELNENA